MQHSPSPYPYVIFMILLGVAALVPDSALKTGLTFLLFAAVFVSLIVAAHKGYRRRLPYWTRDSWRRFLWMCAIPVVAWLVMIGMMFALEYRLPIVGGPRSGQRMVWAIGLLLCMSIGVSGTTVAVDFLLSGEPSRQFTWPFRRPAATQQR